MHASLTKLNLLLSHSGAAARAAEPQVCTAAVHWPNTAGRLCTESAWLQSSSAHAAADTQWPETDWLPLNNSEQLQQIIPRTDYQFAAKCDGQIAAMKPAVSGVGAWLNTA